MMELLHKKSLMQRKNNYWEYKINMNICVISGPANVGKTKTIHLI